MQLLTMRDIQTPYIADFSVTESFESTQGMSSVAISPSILRADFTQNGTTGEGMFTADVVPLPWAREWDIILSII